MVHAAEGTLQAYLDGEVDSTAESALREHVAACAACAAELETLRDAGGVVHQSLSLMDSPPPVLRAQAAIAREKRGGTRRMARIGAWGLAKAAMLLLVLAGAGAAAIPDVRRAIETTFSRVVAMFGGNQEQTAAAPAQPESVDPAAQPPVVQGESFVRPANGRVQILLEGPDSGTLEVLVRLVDEPQAHIATATAAAGSLRVGTGELEITDLGSGTVTIGIPRDVRDAWVEVDGVVHAYMDDGLLHGSDAATRGSEVRFIVGS